jgi:hypothetical protein
MAEAQTELDPAIRAFLSGYADQTNGSGGGGDPQGRDLAAPGSPYEVRWGGAKGNELVTTPRGGGDNVVPFPQKGGGGGDHVQQIFRDTLKAELPGLPDTKGTQFSPLHSRGQQARRGARKPIFNRRR